MSFNQEPDEQHSLVGPNPPAEPHVPIYNHLPESSKPPPGPIRHLPSAQATPSPRLEQLVINSVGRDSITCGDPGSPHDRATRISGPSSKAGLPVGQTTPSQLVSPNVIHSPSTPKEVGAVVRKIDKNLAKPSRESPLPRTFWTSYNQTADFEDQEFVKSVGGNLDTLLIFAGLFSGVNTAFIIEAMKNIQPDKVAQTNELILSVILVLQNATTPIDPHHPPPFVPTSENVRSTSMFFASLSCSLAAAFGAVLGKQWLNHYEREGGLKPPASRGRQRQKKYDGRADWHMEGVLETLPTILQISLFFFLTALVDLLWPINRIVGGVVMGFSLALVCFYVITTVIATMYPLSPFQTRISITMRIASITIHTAFIRITVATQTVLHNLQLSVSNIPAALWNLSESPIIKWMLMSKLHDMLIKLPLTLHLALEMVIVVALLLLNAAWRLCLFLLRSIRKLVGHSVPHALHSIPRIIRSARIQARSMAAVTDATLDLRCLIFYAERASSPEDFHQLLATMDVIPTNTLLDASHSALASLGETLLKFIIRPIASDKPAKYESLLTPGEFQYLLRPLHLLYSSWDQLDDPYSYSISFPYFDTYSCMIWHHLVDILASNPRNPMSASLIVDVLIILIRRSDTLKQPRPIPALNFATSTILDKPNNLLSIRLLALRMHDDEYPRFPEGINSNDLILALLLEMESDTIDVRPPNNRVWAELLPSHLGETQPELVFSRWLVKCCKSYLALQESSSNSEHQKTALISGLRGIYQLLQQRPDSTIWPQALVQDGASQLLLQVTGQVFSFPLKGFAVLCYVTLWRRGQSSHSAMALRAPSQYFLSDSLTTIARYIWCIQEITSGMLEGINPVHIAQGMEYLVEFFETASNMQLLTPGMKSHIALFQREGPCHWCADPERRTQLYERIDRLEFL